MSRGQALRDRAAFYLVLLGLWELTGRWAGPELIGTPLLVARHVGAWLAEGVLAAQVGYTLVAAFAGFLIGGVPGLLLPLVLRRRPFLTSVLSPFIVIGYGLPKVALIPLFILWFGIGIWSKVALVASVSFFLVYFSMAEGVRAVEPGLLRMARVSGASEAQILRTIVLPSSLPFVFQAVQLALPLSIGGAAVAELISSNRGLGYLIQSSAANFEISGALAAVAALAAVVALTNVAVSAAEAHLLSWRPRLAADTPQVI